MAAGQFRNDYKPPPSEAVISDKIATGGGIKQALETQFAALSESEQSAVIKELAAHHKYIEDLRTASAARISAVIKRTESTPFGPGAYLARWQQLMDNTVITPATYSGPVRYGGSQSVKAEAGKDVDGTKTTASVPDENKPLVAPKVDMTIKLMAEGFRNVLATE